MRYHTEEIYAPQGLLAQNLPNYEYRKEQARMAEEVYHCLKSSQHALIEAGTGVGKSLAYLIPAIFFAVQEGKRVVVTTNTLNLQEQLFHKDIPNLAEILPLQFTSKIFKGRQNYNAPMK